MGNSKSRNDDRYLSSHNGHRKIKKEIICPICQHIFIPKTPYSVIDSHIETHSAEFPPSPIPEDHFFPKSEAKILPIRSKISALKVHWSESHIEVRVSRESILQDSELQLLSMTSENLRSEFHVNFLGETSSDAGGLTKEWLNLLITELFDEKRKLFCLTKCENPKYILVPHNKSVESYKLFGIVLGKGVLENIPLNCCLCRVLLKHLLGKTCNLRDVKYLDSELYQSIEFMMENSVEGVFFESFSVVFEGKVYGLVDEGEGVTVNDENKEAYVLLRTEYEVYGAFLEAVEAVKEGFFSVVPQELLKGLGHKDLNYMICGNPYINLNDWITNTEYAGDYTEKHKVICWFWEIICGLKQEKLRKLLQFVTGTSQVPIDGFGKLRTLRGDPAKFKITSVDYGMSRLPRAHTCFNRLDLPVYPSKELMRQALEEVLNYHLLGFGID